MEKTNPPENLGGSSILRHDQASFQKPGFVAIYRLEYCIILVLISQYPFPKTKTPRKSGGFYEAVAPSTNKIPGGEKLNSNTSIVYIS